MTRRDGLEARESMEKPQNRLRRYLVPLIILQAALLVCLGVLLWPAPGGQPDQQTPGQAQFHLPSAATVVPGSVATTPAPGPGSVRVGPLVNATSYTDRARMFDVERAFDHIIYLASDALGGRRAGSADAEAAANYIAAHFAAAGLEPAGDDSAYFQTFTLPTGIITSLPVLAITSPSGEPVTHTYAYRIDYRALTSGYVGAGEAEGELLWLNGCHHNDYAGLDASGKIILCRVTNDPDVYRQAIEHQVGGLLLLDRESDYFRRGGYRDTAWVPETIPAYLISEQVGEDLLTGTGYTLDDLSLLFDPIPLSTTVRMVVNLDEREDGTGRNVLGLLPGADPQHADEVVVIGAHYDHLGREPDGAIMSGANDNSSGVGTVLEIARLWHDQGYRPARSVLFAAWDGEELGLLGSHYYVQHPTLPITHIVANINLDMVGRGETLLIDGEGAVAAQLQASAELYAVTTTRTFNGRSDHVPFIEGSIPAAMLIYWPDPPYHSPADRVETIEPDHLRSVGVIAAHTLSALAQSDVELEEAVARLQNSIAAGDRAAFLAGIDPDDPDLQAAQAAWFDNLWSRELTEVTIAPDQVRVGDGEADVTLTMSYRWADSDRREPSISYDVRFVQRDGVWVWAGYDLDSLAGDVVTVARFEEVPLGVSSLLSTTQASYLALAADLGARPVSGTRVIYYPNTAMLRTIAQPAADRDTRWLVPSAGLAEIAWGQPITPALVSLLLDQMGLPGDAAPWLREGLARRYESGATRESLPALLSVGAPSFRLDAFPLADDLPADAADSLRAQAWSVTGYLLERYGPDGLRALCAAWGESGSGAVAFQQALGLTADQFLADWQASQIDPLRADAEAIAATVAARTGAVLAGDEASFLATVNPADATLRTEERHWFAALVDTPVLSYEASGQVVDWSPAGDETVVELTVSSVLSGERSARITYDARFVHRGGRWLYAGVAWQERSSDHFVLKYQGNDAAWAHHVLDLAEEAYSRIAGDLDVGLAQRQEIKLYGEPELFRALVSPALPGWVTGWVEPGESIRLPTQEESQLHRALAHELGRVLLFERGLEGGWLHEGVADYEAGRVLPLGTHWMAGEYVPLVQAAVRRHAEFPLDGLPSGDDLPEDQVELFRAQSWSLVSFIARQHGLGGLRQLIARAALSDDTPSNLRAALGVDPAQFEAAWRAQASDASVPPELVALARRFDPERALAHIQVLASAEYGGRQAGTAGADLASAYIADQFAALGFQPLGDPLTETVGSERGYRQWFPISHTHLLSTPVLVLLDGETVVRRFVYRQDFVERSGQGAAEGPLLWLNASDLEGMRFGGAVVIEANVSDPIARAAELEAHAAGGLVVVTDREPEELRATIGRFTPETAITIPVFELGGPAFESLLEQLDTTYRDLINGPPVLPLGLQARQSLLRLPLTTTLTANVIGLLPGSDPRLANELLLVGAHYDHIGQLPNGLFFPGANQNGSGVAAMLELARVWQEAGYHPARSVLFVAWGAEEMDSAGVSYYLNHPAVPLTRTLGVIALDSIASGRGYDLLYYGTREHDLPLIQRVEAGASELERRAWRRGSSGEGWHQPFNRAGIPTVLLIWEDAEQDFYSLADTADSIDLDRLASSGEILTLAVSWLEGQ